MSEQPHPTEFLEPGDVFFVAANHPFAKLTTQFQTWREVENIEITHVAIAADTSTVIEAQKKGATAVPIPFDEWRAKRSAADSSERYCVLRHPTLSMAEKLIPVMDAVIYVEKERYARIASALRTPTPPGRSNCANLAARVLARAGLADLSDLLAATQILPGELLEHLEKQGFRELPWDTLVSSGSAFSDGDLIDIHRRDRWSSWGLNLSLSSLDGLEDAALESLTQLDTETVASYFRGLRENFGSEMFSWFLGAVDSAIFSHDATFHAFDRGSPHWSVDRDFEDMIRRELASNLKHSELVLCLLHLAQGAFSDILKRIAINEELQEVFDEIRRRQFVLSTATVSTLLDIYAGLVFDFVMLTGVLPSHRFLEGFEYVPTRETAELAPELEVDARKHPLAETLYLVADIAECCSLSILRYEEFLVELIPEGFPVAKSQILNSLRNVGLLPANPLVCDH